MSDPIARAIDIYASRLAIRPRHPHTHSRAQLEPKPLIEPSAAGCRRPGDEDEPRDFGSAHSRAASGTAKPTSLARRSARCCGRLLELLDDSGLTGEGRMMSLVNRSAEDPTSGADLEVSIWLILASPA